MSVRLKWYEGKKNLREKAQLFSGEATLYLKMCVRLSVINRNKNFSADIVDSQLMDDMPINNHLLFHSHCLSVCLF